jgi:hypothetical protein
MAENETQDQQEQQGTESSSGAKTAMKAAAAAAATGAAAVAVRKALSGSNGKSHLKDLTSRNGKSDGKSEGGPGSFLTSIASGGWDAARDALVPLAEDAAGAAGTYLAKNGPEFVRETIVPRFIESFNDARED